MDTQRDKGESTYKKESESAGRKAGRSHNTRGSGREHQREALVVFRRARTKLEQAVNAACKLSGLIKTESRMSKEVSKNNQIESKAVGH